MKEGTVSIWRGGREFWKHPDGVLLPRDETDLFHDGEYIEGVTPRGLALITSIDSRTRKAERNAPELRTYESKVPSGSPTN